MFLAFIFAATNIGAFMGSDATQNATNLEAYFNDSLTGYPLDYVTEFPDGCFGLNITKKRQILIYPDSTYLVFDEGSQFAVTFDSSVNWQDYKGAFFVVGDGDVSFKGLQLYGPSDYVTDPNDTSKGIVTWYGGVLGPNGWGDGRLSVEDCTITGFAYGVYARVESAPGQCRVNIQHSVIEAYVGASIYHDGSSMRHELSAFDSTFRTTPIENGHGNGIYVHRGVSMIVDGCAFQTKSVIQGVTQQKHGIQQYGLNDMQCRFISISRCTFDGNSDADYQFRGRAIGIYATNEPVRRASIRDCDFLGPGIDGAAIELGHPIDVERCTFTSERGLTGYGVSNTLSGTYAINDCYFAVPGQYAANVMGANYEWEFNACQFNIANMDGWSVIRTQGSATVAGVSLYGCQVFGGQTADIKGIYHGAGPLLVLGGSYDFAAGYNEYGFNSLGYGGHIEDATIHQTGGAGLTDPAGTWTLTNNTIY